MSIVVNNIKMPIVHNIDEVFEAARKSARLNCVAREDMFVFKKSLDARRKSDIHYVYSVVITSEGADTACGSNDNVRKFDVPEDVEIKPSARLVNSPVVVGSGPAGLFSAYILARYGCRPILLERGCDADERARRVEEFWRGGRLDENTNIQFGEGGAGTFSDGKLNSRIGDPLQRFVLKTFVTFGAPEEILFDARPHIGTDILKDVVKNMRRGIEALGGTVRFNAFVTDIKIKGGAVCGVEVNGSEILDCSELVLAIGHSSRDTYECLARRGAALEPKPFAVGVRIEHTQEFINYAQYGEAARLGILPPAEYRLAMNGKERSCFSFCMCPGGTVVNSSSERGGLAVNGMSNSARDGVNADSALVVSVRPSDFESSAPLGGVEFQRRYERLAYELADGGAPIQLSRDFLNDVKTTRLGSVTPTFTGNTRLCSLRKCLPEFVSETLCDGLRFFDKKMRGFATGDAVMTGVETRTSAPLRILRGGDGQSLSIRGMYPSGEGAGYAGGIMSAAVDGIKIAKHILENE